MIKTLQPVAFIGCLVLTLSLAACDSGSSSSDASPGASEGSETATTSPSISPPPTTPPAPAPPPVTERPIPLQASTYGEEWPFPEFDTALLDCKPHPTNRRPMVIVKLGDTWYGLNGAAMGVGGYPTAREKFARHPEYDTFLLGATDEFIDRGLALCGR